jgi:large subunit ribosomal protein L25
MNEVDIRCLPAHLPEFIEVDLSHITVAHSIHARDLKLPEGVELALRGGENPSVVTAQVPKAVVSEEEVAAAAAAEAAAPAPSEVPAAKQKAEPVEPAAPEKPGKK